MNNEIKITLNTIADTKGINTITIELGKLNSIVNDSNLGNLDTKIINFSQSMQGLDYITRIAKSTIGAFISQGIDTASQFEQMQIGIASLIAVNSQNSTAMGKAITDEQKYAAAKTETLDVVRELRKANLETPATLSQLTQGYQSALGPLMKYGATQKQSIDYATKMTQAAAAMGVPMDMLSQEMRSIISGTIDMNSTVATNLGITNEQIKAHKKQGDLMEWLSGKLSAFSLAGKDISNSWSGVTSNLEDTMDTVSSVSVKPLMDSMKADMTDFTTWLTSTTLANSENITNLGNDVMDKNTTNAEMVGIAISKVFYVIYNGAKLSLEGIYALFQLSVNGWLKIGYGLASNYNEIWSMIYEGFRNVVNKIIGGIKSFNSIVPDMFKINTAGLDDLSNSLNKKMDASHKKALAYSYVVDKIDLDTISIANNLDKTVDNAFKGYFKIGQQTIENTKATDKLNNKTGDTGDASDKAGSKAKAAHDKAAKALENHLKKLDELGKKYNEIMGDQKAIFADKLESTLREFNKEGFDPAKIAEIKVKITADYQNDWYSKYYNEIGDKQKSLAIELNKKMEEFRSTGLFTDDQLSKLANTYKQKMEEANDQISLNFSDQFKSMFESLSKGDLSGALSGFMSGSAQELLKGPIDSLSKGLNGMMTKGIEALGGGATGALTGMLGFDPISMIAGIALSIIPSLFSSTVSQAEIDKAKGRTDYKDESIKNSLSIMESTAYPMLEATHDMRKYLRSMEQNFGSVAKAITGKASSSGIDLTGVNFVETLKTGFLGFSSKQISLIGTGLKFQAQSLENMISDTALLVQGYTTTLVQKSSWWGLVKKEYISEKYQNLPSGIVNDLANAFSDGYLSILTAGATLGLDKTNLAAALDKSQINLGKIDFTGLSQQEVADRLSSAISEALGGVVDGIGSFATLVNRYATSAENSLETLMRIATEYDQASHMFNLIGKNFTNGLYSTQMQVLDIVKSTGGLTKFNDDMGSFMDNFYTDSEKAGFLTKSMNQAFSTLNLTMPKTKEEFRNLVETFSTGTENGSYLTGQIISLADSFNKMVTATENLNKKVSDAAKNIADAWTGNLSYLTLQEKSLYASRYLELTRRSNGVLDSVEAARANAELALKTTATKADYIPIFAKYIQELEKTTKDATNLDLLNELKALKAEVIALRRATTDIAIYAKGA